MIWYQYTCSTHGIIAQVARKEDAKEIVELHKGCTVILEQIN